MSRVGPSPGVSTVPPHTCSAPLASSLHQTAVTCPRAWHWALHNATDHNSSTGRVEVSVNLAGKPCRRGRQRQLCLPGICSAESVYKQPASTHCCSLAAVGLVALEVFLGRCAGGLAAGLSCCRSVVLLVLLPVVALLRAVMSLRASLVARSRSRASAVLDRKLEMRPRRRLKGPSAEGSSSSSELVREGNVEMGLDDR